MAAALAWGILAVAWTACSGGDDITRTAVMDYSSEDLHVDTDFQIFHTSADSSRIFFKLNTRNLLYTRTASNRFSARIEIKVTPYIMDDDHKIKLKSKTIHVIDDDNDKEIKDLLAATDLYLPDQHSYNLSVQITDLNLKRDITKFFRTEKNSPHSRHFFLATELEDERIPIFGDRIEARSTVQLTTNASASGIVHVKYYNRYFPLPPPPFAYYEPKSFDYEPDSTFTVMLGPDNKAKFRAGKNGFYHFQIDPEQREGFTLFVAEPFFPEVSEIEHLIDPFRYVVSSKEYAALINHSEKKRKLESYWLDWCGNKERARSSIEAYYSRVEQANKYFSSHTEGWKSDRGLVYVVYGKPNKVYRSSTLETWIYGEESNPMSISFNFIKVINPFTSNDFRLNREEFYKPTWYRSLEAWRNGRVY